MQNHQTLKTEIVALLDFLPEDSLKTLAEFAAFLQAKSHNHGSITNPIVQEEMAEIKVTTIIAPRQEPIRIPSPRLVKREQIADFKLKVIETAADDNL